MPKPASGEPSALNRFTAMWKYEPTRVRPTTTSLSSGCRVMPSASSLLPPANATGAMPPTPNAGSRAPFAS